MLKLALVPDSLGYMPFEEMLDTAVALGIEALEFPTGGWSKAPHFHVDEIIESAGKRTAFQDSLNRRGLKIAALNCSGNHLAVKADMETVEKTFRAAELLGVKKIVMMSGLPSGKKGEETPVWITTSWPPITMDILEYQWNQVAIPAWERLVKQAADCGIEQIALENHGWQLVYNPRTLFRLRQAVGSMVGMNLDPGHLFWMGGDPIAAVRELGDALYHIHGKDARIERGLVDANGVLDTYTIDRFAERTWNYVAMGCGHGLDWWREFFSVVRMTGYNDYVSLEMEDLTMDPYQGVKISVDLLKDSM